MSSMPSAIVLDLDGVVADTEPPSLAAVAETYAAAGVELTDEELRATIGIEFGRLEPLLRARNRVAASPDELRREYDRRYLARLRAGVEPNPGLVPLLAAAAESGVPVAVASSSPLHQVELVLETTGVRAAIGVVAAGSEVPHTKPAPDVYLLALKRLGVAAAGAVAIEDSAPGIAAARAAGLPCVAVRTPVTNGHDLSAASLVVDSLGELTLASLGRVALDRERLKR